MVLFNTPKSLYALYISLTIPKVAPMVISPLLLAPLTPQDMPLYLHNLETSFELKIQSLLFYPNELLLCSIFAFELLLFIDLSGHEEATLRDKLKVSSPTPLKALPFNDEVNGTSSSMPSSSNIPSIDTLWNLLKDKPL